MWAREAVEDLSRPGRLLSTSQVNNCASREISYLYHRPLSVLWIERPATLAWHCFTIYRRLCVRRQAAWLQPVRV
jgi:hypothetical protein